MTTQVYIITKEGRSYTDEGIRYVANGLQENFGVDPGTIEYNSGTAFNKPGLLAKQLTKHENAYVVLSTNSSVIFFPKPLNSILVEDLTNNPQLSSWEILMLCSGEMKDEGDEA